MYFLKIYVALMFLIILLSLNIGSSVGGDNFRYAETLKFLPYTPSEGQSSSSQLQETCFVEINGVFPENLDFYYYVQYAINNLTLENRLTYYLKEYYKIFVNYAFPTLQTVQNFCKIYPGKRRKECIEAINLFLLVNPEDNKYYKPSYIPTITHLSLEEVVIDPIILMGTALYHLTEKKAKAALGYVDEYFKSLSSEFIVVERPSNNHLPFLKPAAFCKWFIENEKKRKEQQGQTSNPEIIDLDPVPDNDLNLELRL